MLRLVTSGIPDTEDWDSFYEGTKRGWTIFLMSLRHYLERHAGTPRDQIVSTVGVLGSCEDAWPVLWETMGSGWRKRSRPRSLGNATAGGPPSGGS